MDTISKKIFKALMVVAFMAGAGQVFAFSGGFGNTESGGTSEGTDSTLCDSIGDETSGDSFSGSFENTSGTGSEDCVGEDSDGDSMLNTWELTFSLDKNDATDAYADSDGDGSTNAREHAQGTLADTADSDGDGINDGDDADPNDNGVSVLTLDGSYKGSKAALQQQ